MAVITKLHISETITINRGIRQNDNPLDVTVERNDHIITINSVDGAITVDLSIDEVRAIVDTFGVLGDSESKAT